MASILCVLAVSFHGGAHAASCSRAVVFTLPTTAWADVARFRPPNLLQLVEEGATGSVSVRTPMQPTMPGSGFATLGAGAGVVVRPSWGRPTQGLQSRRLFERNVRVSGLSKMRETLRRIGYGSVEPGALGSASEGRVLVAIGNADLE